MHRWSFSAVKEESTSVLQVPQLNVTILYDFGTAGEKN